MKAGIVICAWNCKDEVKRAVSSAIETCSKEDTPFAILLHDDHSELEPLKPAFDEWKLSHTEYFCQPRRNGLTSAWNTGITWAVKNNCDCVVLANQDVQFVKGWLARFVKDVKTCPALSPLSNSPGIHSHTGTLQGQDIRNFISEFQGKEVEPIEENFTMIMERIKFNVPVQADGIKGFFLGFRIEWLWDSRLGDEEFFSMKHATANCGVGGSENEIFHRVGIKPWIATDFYIHHFRKQGNNIGKARTLFRQSAASRGYLK